MPIRSGWRAMHWPATGWGVSDPCCGRFLVQGRTPNGLALCEPDEGVDGADVQQLGLLSLFDLEYILALSKIVRVHTST